MTPESSSALAAGTSVQPAAINAVTRKAATIINRTPRCVNRFIVRSSL